MVFGRPSQPREDYSARRRIAAFSCSRSEPPASSARPAPSRRAARSRRAGSPCGASDIALVPIGRGRAPSSDDRNALTQALVSELGVPRGLEQSGSQSLPHGSVPGGNLGRQSGTDRRSGDTLASKRHLRGATRRHLPNGREARGERLLSARRPPCERSGGTHSVANVSPGDGRRSGGRQSRRKAAARRNRRSSRSCRKTPRRSRARLHSSLLRQSVI